MCVLLNLIKKKIKINTEIAKIAFAVTVSYNIKISNKILKI